MLNAKKTVLKKDSAFDEAFNIFDEINKCDKLNEQKPRTSNKINTKNAILEYLKIIENLHPTEATLDSFKFKGLKRQRLKNHL